MVKRMLELSVVITRNYGKHSVEFGMKEICEISSGSHRRSAYNNIVGQLNDQIEQYETVNLNQIRLPEQSTEAVKSDSFVAEIPVSEIIVESKNGKRRMSAKGGQYSKHGVAIYEDTCQTDLVLSNYDYGTHDISMHNLIMYVDIVGGMPKRALSIR